MIPWETAKMHAGIGSINRKLIGDAKDKPYTLDLGNSLWVDRNFNLADEFSRKVIDAYGTGAAKECDFVGSPDEERKRLNGWVEEKTREKIKELFPEDSIKDTTVMVLANAIYFKGDWETKFDPKNTHDAKFKKADGSEKTVKMMVAMKLM